MAIERTSDVRSVDSVGRLSSSNPYNAYATSTTSTPPTTMTSTTTSKDAKMKISVAQDMHQGATPPAYHRQGSDPNLQPSQQRGPVVAMPAAATSDGRPGSSHSHGHDHAPGHHPNCAKCGKRTLQGAASISTTSLPQVVSPGSALLAQAQPYVAPPGAASSQRPYSGVTGAGPSSSLVGLNEQLQPRICQKCGKKKKPVAATVQAPSPYTPSSLQQTGQAGLRIMPSHSNNNSKDSNGLPQIDVVPPSLAPYRPISSLSTLTSIFNDGVPLIAGGQQQPQQRPQTQSQFSGVNNLIRSLSKRMSGRMSTADDRKSDGPLPSQQLRSSNRPESGTPGNLINMISNAIKESGQDSDAHSNYNGSRQSYQRLSAGDIQSQVPDRPASPFSFMSVVQEDDNDNQHHDSHHHHLHHHHHHHHQSIDDSKNDGGYEMVELSSDEIDRDREREKHSIVRDSDGSTVVASHTSPLSLPRINTSSNKRADSAVAVVGAEAEAGSGAMSPESATSLYSPDIITMYDSDADQQQRNKEIMIRQQAEKRQAERRAQRADPDLLVIPEDGSGAAAENAYGYGARSQPQPQITRFKSLRQGVNRMASTISRETSLKRLDSLKNLHTNWYRDDMAIEGYNYNEDSVPVY